VGRFSPSVLPGPSWTQGLEQGAQNFTSQLMQRRQFNLAKQREVFDENIKTQDQARQNAQAGYDPTYIPSVSDAQSGTVAPTDLSKLSNASVGDASRPDYDPTQSLTFALMNGRGEWADKRNQDSIAGRHQDVIQRGVNTDRAIGLKYGTFNPDGTPESMGAMTGSKLQTQAPVLQQRNDQFQKRESDRAADLSEKIRYDSGRLAQPVRAGRAAPVGGASGNSATGPEMTYIRNGMQRLMGTQSVPLLDDKGNPTPFTNKVSGQSATGAFNTMKHNANMVRLGAGVTDTIPDAPTKAPPPPPAAAGNYQSPLSQSGPAASIFTAPGKNLAPTKSEDAPTAPPSTGNVKTLDSGRVTDQHTSTASTTIPANPTDGNGGSGEAAKYNKFVSDINASSLSPQEKASRISRATDIYRSRVKQ
jgi:hypothetical protein